MPADLDNESWQEKQAQLAVQFPDMDWAQLATSYSNAARNPVYGQIMPQGAALVETDPGSLARDNVVTSLTLHEILPLPPGNDLCEQMSLLAQQVSSNQQPMQAEVLRRSDQNDCIVVVHQQIRRQNTISAPAPIPSPRARSGSPCLRVSSVTRRGR